MNAFFQNIITYVLMIILFIFYYFFGLAIVKRFARKLVKRLTNLELVFISFFVGLFFQIWISFIIALIVRSIIIAHIISIFVGVIFIFYNKRDLLNKNNVLYEINKHKTSVVIFLVITIILLFTVFFRFEGEEIYCAPPSCGDWALHISLINSFAKGNNIPPMYTFYSSEKLGYPFLNFYANALLINLGLDIYYAFNIFQFILTFSLLMLSYLLGLRLFGKNSYAILFSLILFFGGGLGWIYIFQSDDSFLSTIANQDYYVMHSKNILPINLSIHSYSMRTGLLGWIYIVVIFIFLFNEVFNREKWRNLKEYFLILFLIGGLFFFHSYSFLIIMLFLSLIWVQKPVKSLILLLLGSSILALPQLLGTRSQTTRKGFLRFIDGLFVSITKPIAFIWMWIKNFGLVILFAVFGFKKYKHLWLPFFGFFVIGNVVVFQPWEWDNQKLLIACYFILTIFGIEGIKNVWEQKYKTWFSHFVSRFLTILLILVVFLPSVFGTYHYYKKSGWFSDREDQILGEFIGKLVPKNAIILTATQHNHPVFLYSGRKVFEGYRGWIWSHGLDMEARDKETKAMFESIDKEKACKLFRKNNVDYVFISDWERREELYKVNEDFFINNFKIAYNEKEIFLFQVKC